MIRNELFFWIGGLRSTLFFKQWDTDTDLVYCFESITDWCAISKTQKHVLVGREAVKVAAQHLASELNFGLEGALKPSGNSTDTSTIDITGVLLHSLVTRLTPVVLEQTGINLKDVSRIHLLDPGAFFQGKHQRLVCAMNLFHPAQAYYHSQLSLVEGLKGKDSFKAMRLAFADEVRSANPAPADSNKSVVDVHHTFIDLLTNLQKDITETSQALLAAVDLFDDIEYLGLGDWVEHAYGYSAGQQSPLIVDSLHFWQSFQASYDEVVQPQDNQATLYIGDYSNAYKQQFPQTPTENIMTMTRHEVVNAYQANITKLPLESCTHLKIEVNSEPVSDPGWHNTDNGHECELQQSINLFGNTSARVDIQISDSIGLFQSWVFELGTLLPLNMTEYKIQLNIGKSGNIRCGISTGEDTTVSSIQKHCFRSSGTRRNNDILNRIVYIT